MARITFDDKVDRVTTSYLRINKVIADDVNEIKASVNALYDFMDNLRQRIQVNIDSGDFTGGYIDITDTVGLTAQEDFNVYTNEGSGVLLKLNDGYTFNDVLGRITMSPGNYSIIIYKPLA